MPDDGGDEAMQKTMGRALRFVSLTAFLTTLLIYSPNMMALHGSDTTELTSHFAEPLLLATFLVALLVALVPGLRRAVATRGVGLASFVLYGVGELTFAALLLLQPGWGAPVATAASVVAAGALVPVCTAWVDCLRGFDLRRCLQMLALAFAISALCNMALTALGAPWSLLAFMALVVAGVAWPALGLARGTTGGPRASLHPQAVEEGAPGESAPSAHPYRAAASAFLSVMGVPLLGMAISSFAMGVQPAFLFGEVVDAQHLGMLVADALLLAVAIAWGHAGRRPLFSLLYQVLLPACVALALVLCSFPVDSLVHEVGLAAIYVFYSMVSCVGVAVAAATANAGEFSRSGMVAALVAVFCGTGILGIFLGAQVADLIDNNALVLIILTAAYGCWLLLSGCLKSWRLMVDTDAVQGARGESLDERIARLAAQAGLSPRETEVLGFVGRGHSSVYVAKTLLISESTVYTHVRNLYRKLGVGTREELIQLLNGRA
ncbi:MAG: helix-turn-helix transcriptional regulator [Coriobacteriia bacterium]|nr:helix-turn-helix transcriptional regulator [Coriobacteriia bacterium]MBS5479255.1 helix-turn-helix transcriptional regulator [Coriobacteriia bacterium]